MNDKLINDYVSLLNQYIIDQELGFTEKSENQYIDKLDKLWFEMNNDEIIEVEKLLQSSPGTQESLGLIDVTVYTGTTILPRTTKEV